MTAPNITADMLEFDEPDRIRKALRLSGLSVGEMAEYLGVKPETCSRYINGRAKIPLQTMRLWALRTGVPFEWLKTGKIPRPNGPGEGLLLPHLDSNQKPAGLQLHRSDLHVLRDNHRLVAVPLSQWQRRAARAAVIRVTRVMAA